MQIPISFFFNLQQTSWRGQAVRFGAPKQISYCLQGLAFRDMYEAFSGKVLG